MLMTMPDFMGLTRDLCELPTTGIVADGNEDFFSRVEKELPLRLYRYPSGATVNGWIVPPIFQTVRPILWRAESP